MWDHILKRITSTQQHAGAGAQRLPSRVAWLGGLGCPQQSRPSGQRLKFKQTCLISVLAAKAFLDQRGFTGCLRKGICCFRFLVSRVEPDTPLPLFLTQGLFIVAYDLLGFITKFHQL